MVFQFMFKKNFLLHATYLEKTLQILTYAFHWLYFTHCLASFYSINHLLHLYAWFFDSISSNIDEVLLINPSVNVFVLGDFNVYHKNWLTYSGGTDQPGELCYNISISKDLNQMVNFPTRISDCDSHSPALFD